MPRNRNKTRCSPHSDRGGALSRLLRASDALSADRPDPNRLAIFGALDELGKEYGLDL